MRINQFDADWYKARIVVERSIFSLALRVALTRMTVMTELGVRGRQAVDDILSKACCFSLLWNRVFVVFVQSFNVAFCLWNYEDRRSDSSRVFIFASFFTITVSCSHGDQRHDPLPRDNSTSLTDHCLFLEVELLPTLSQILKTTTGKNTHVTCHQCLCVVILPEDKPSL